MRVIPDVTWAVMNIYAEARGEPFKGQVAVGNVMRERMRLKYMSDGTIAGTVWAPNQFSWTLRSDHQRLHVLLADDETVAWRQALEAWGRSAEQWEVPKGTVHYFADYIEPPSWAADMEEVAHIGRHKFFKRGDG